MTPELASIALVLVLVVLVCGYLYKSLRTRAERGEDHTAFVPSFDTINFSPPVIPRAEMAAEITQQQARALADTSVSIDFPRLAPTMRIFKDDRLLLDCPERFGGETQAYPGERSMQAVLCVLTELLEGPDRATEVDTAFVDDFAYMAHQRSTDPAVFLRSFLATHFSETSVVVSVLKAVTQCLFASAVQFYIPLRIKFPYGDVKNGWNVDVLFSETGLEVRHHKREKSLGSDAFHFEWRLSVFIDPATTRVTDVTTAIESISFAPTFPASAQREFNQIVSKLN